MNHLEKEIYYANDALIDYRSSTQRFLHNICHFMSIFNTIGRPFRRFLGGEWVFVHENAWMYSHWENNITDLSQEKNKVHNKNIEIY